MTEEELLGLPEPDFRDIVDDDTRGRLRGKPWSVLSQDERDEADLLGDLLRSRTVAGRWQETLLGMARSVEGQLAKKKADSKAKVAELRSQGLDHEVDNAVYEHTRWRAGALRFKAGLEERLMEAQRLVRSYHRNDPSYTDQLIESRDRALVRVALLEDAIRRHRERQAKASPEDRALWEALNA